MAEASERESFDSRASESEASAGSARAARACGEVPESEASAGETPACLIIMDGFGLAEPSPGNAISLADTPCLDGLFANRPWTKLEASGEAVGLPAGQMGNSEVGHLNIGAGRVVFQELTRINRACADGTLAHNSVLGQAFSAACEPGAALHVMGLLSDGGVHSSNAHLYALLRAARDAGVSRIMVHCFMDGRDVPPKSGLGYIEDLEREIAAIELEPRLKTEQAHERESACAQEQAYGQEAATAVAETSGQEGSSCSITIASISGRYFAMDRDKRWDRVERAWRALVLANPVVPEGTTPVQVMEASYDAGVTDEFVEPVALCERGLQDGDAVVFFNFRPDRAREITRSLVDESFEGFSRSRFPRVSFVCLTEYDPDIASPVAFAKEFPENVLADVFAQKHLRQYHIAETEKYAHVTFFLNGGREEAKCGEDRVLVASPKVATYDLQPAMSEPEVAKKLACAIDAHAADVYIVNFANCDMVGHTGVIPAAVSAVEAVDAGVSCVLEAMKRAGGMTLVTADHGNADKMIAEDGTPHTAHTTALVPLVLVDETGLGRSLKRDEGALCDIAPTLLELMGIEAPPEMTGRSLLA